MFTRIVLRAGLAFALLGVLGGVVPSPGSAASPTLGVMAPGRDERLVPQGIAQASSDDSCAQAPAADSEIATPPPDERLTGGVPDGIAFTPLAAGAVDELPLLPARLSLSRQTFAPSAEIPPTTATGPILFLVERGTLTIFVSGVGEHYGPGEFAVVQVGQRYSLLNETAAAATTLRLAVDKLSASDAPVMRVEQLTPIAGGSSLRPTSARLFQATIDRVPQTSVLLFVGCERWTATLPDGVVHRHPGAVALRMISGTVRIDDGLPLGADGCRLFNRLTPYRVLPAEDAPAAFLFGVVPANQRLWLTGEEAPAPPAASAGVAPNVSCG